MTTYEELRAAAVAAHKVLAENPDRVSRYNQAVYELATYAGRSVLDTAIDIGDYVSANS
jgi:hypothetical protein